MYKWDTCIILNVCMFLTYSAGVYQLELILRYIIISIVLLLSSLFSPVVGQHSLEEDFKPQLVGMSSSNISIPMNLA